MEMASSLAVRRIEWNFMLQERAFLERNFIKLYLSRSSWLKVFRNLDLNPFS